MQGVVKEKTPKMSSGISAPSSTRKHQSDSLMTSSKKRVRSIKIVQAVELAPITLDTSVDRCRSRELDPELQSVDVALEPPKNKSLVQEQPEATATDTHLAPSPAPIDSTLPATQLQVTSVHQSVQTIEALEQDILQQHQHLTQKVYSLLEANQLKIKGLEAEAFDIKSLDTEGQR